MTYASALIIYVDEKHDAHEQILKDLQDEEISQDDLNVPNNSTVACQIEAELLKKICAVDILVIYISNKTKNNICIASAVAIAQRLNKKIIAIWLGIANDADLGQALGKFADEVISYDGSVLKDILHGVVVPWVKADGTAVPKRVIPKHTCG